MRDRAKIHSKFQASQTLIQLFFIFNVHNYFAILVRTRRKLSRSSKYLKSILTIYLDAGRK